MTTPVAGPHFPPVLTTAMAAELLQVHAEYLRRMVREGRIPCHRFPGGRGLRFLRDELLEWLAAQPGADQSSSTRGPRIHATVPSATTE
ncbi:MAG TPA: helix-turn-helix domain-containing protein [Acidimicrobiia bacterium]|nr:helix-turn-helix domain-containing protein [Acidimicrobiia bacterium]